MKSSRGMVSITPLGKEEERTRVEGGEWVWEVPFPQRPNQWMDLIWINGCLDKRRPVAIVIVPVFGMDGRARTFRNQTC